MTAVTTVKIISPGAERISRAGGRDSVLYQGVNSSVC